MQLSSAVSTAIIIEQFSDILSFFQNQNFVPIEQQPLFAFSYPKHPSLPCVSMILIATDTSDVSKLTVFVHLILAYFI